MSPVSFHVALDTGVAVTALHYPASEPVAAATLLLAHGAGADQRSAFMVAFAAAMSDYGFDAVTFNFPYTEQRRRAPDRAPVLEACYRAVVAGTRERVPGAAETLFIGGKSMGGRIATQIAAADPLLPIHGLVLLGYPLHPPGAPERRRDAHLPAIRQPVLVVQGSGDTFGTPEELRPVFGSLSPPATLHVIEGGDHSFKVRRGGAAGQAAVDAEIRVTVADWMKGLIRAR